MTTMVTPATPPVTTARPPTPTEFLRAWFVACPPDHLLELRAICVSDHHVVQDFFTLDAIEDLVGRAFSLVEEFDCYFGTCSRIRPRGDKASVTHVPGLWSDLDFKRFADGEAGAIRKLGEFPIAPTWIVATGGGWHLYWRLREPAKADAAVEGRLKGIAKALNADLAATDLCRVLRIPGTFNHKYVDTMVRIISWPTT